MGKPVPGTSLDSLSMPHENMPGRCKEREHWLEMGK